MKFYLGTHLPHWLRDSDVPLFVSIRRLRDYRTLPVAACEWALDSGGFTELSMHGGYQTSVVDYRDEIVRVADGVGRLEWASPQDWMVEPAMLARTGFDVAEHQRRTTENVLELRMLGTPVPVIPVVQGWTLDDYLRHVDEYAAAGIDLTAEPLVGVGSVCRRQHTAEVEEIAATLAALGVRTHLFGAKGDGLVRYQHHATSADSLSWSYAGRRRPMPDCTHKAKNCANCRRFALDWRERMLTKVDRPRQLPLLFV